MKIEEKRVGSNLLVRILEPRLGADRAASFKQTMSQLIARGELHLLLDLNCVEFIDSSGLGAILSILKRLGNDGELAICGMQEPVASLFKLARMDRILKIYDSREDRIDAISR